MLVSKKKIQASFEIINIKYSMFIYIYILIYTWVGGCVCVHIYIHTNIIRVVIFTREVYKYTLGHHLKILWL